MGSLMLQRIIVPRIADGEIFRLIPSYWYPSKLTHVNSVF